MATAQQIEAARRRDAFVQAYARTGVAEQACIEAGYSARSARTQSSRMMAEVDLSQRAHKARTEFLAAAEDQRKRQERRLVQVADDAIDALHHIVRGGKASGRGAVARVSAATAILDRAGHKPVERKEISGANGAPLVTRIEIVDLMAGEADDSTAA